MTRYILRRLLFMLMTLLVTSIFIFGATQLLPGDMASIILGRDASEIAQKELRSELGFDQPSPIQYLNWLGGFVTGDWGIAYSTFGQPAILPLVFERLGHSLKLALMALILAIPLAILLGVLAGIRENRTADVLISIGTLSVVALPEFVTGLILIQVVAHWLDILPATSTFATTKPFFEAIPELILPSLTATFVLLAYIARLVRAGVIEELKKPYARTAQLKGLPRRRILTKHILRNALLPAITVIAISFGWLMGGIIVIENVFNYRGLGLLLTDAIKSQDLLLLQSITMLIVSLVVLANLIADLLYAALNPRIRLR